jgi:putative Mg2+ transporter-C (MgtC) family protein
MDWNTEITMTVRVIIAAVMGALIGWEREAHGHEAGVRTHATVALGACTFGLISLYVDGGSDPTRIAAQVVTGVGFLGAGVILRDRGRITGLTTAATLWATAAVGLAVAYGMYILGLVSTAIILLLLSMRRFLPSQKNSVSSLDSD